MKRILSALIAVSIIIFQIPVFAADGEGTEKNPYKITTAEELQNINNNLSAYYRIENDIDMSGVDFEPIGNESNGAFTGTLDGNGYTIKNLTLEKEGNKYVGLIGCLEGTVKNTKLDNVKVNGQSARYVGAVVGYAEENAVVENCETLSGSVNGSYIMVDFQIGGIVGYNKGTVSGCNNACKVEYTDSVNNRYVGGVVGYNIGILTDCHNSGSITSGYIAGGIAGFTNGYCEINNCSNEGYVYSYVPKDVHIKVTTDSLGWNPKYYNYGYSGGIIGYANNANIINCINNGKINSKINKPELYSYLGEGCSGGIVGFISNGKIVKCSNNGIIKSDGDDVLNVGGITGKGEKTTIIECENNTNIIANNGFTSYIGGIGGDFQGNIVCCDNRGFITTTVSNATRGGGITGRICNGIIDNCTNKSSIEIISTEYISYGGGIVGETENIKVNNCTNINNIVVKTYMVKEASKYFYDPYACGGGILGMNNSSSTIENCLNTANIMLYNDLARSYGGGINGGGTAEVYNCVNTGSINHIGSTTSTNTYDIAENTKNLYIKSSKITMSPNVTTAIPIELYGYDKDLKWTSADESIAVVDSKGNVTGVSSGETVITAETELGITTSATVVVSGESVGVEIISLNKTSVKLKASETVQLTAEVVPANSNSPITWVSGDTSVATVDSNGLVTAVKKGATTITARIGGGRMFNCVINVVSDEVGADVQSVTINDSEITLAPDDATALNAVVSPIDAIDAEIKYTSDNETVATVNANGIVTAKSAGVAIIRAETLNGCYDECIVRVVSAESSSVILKAEKALPGVSAEVKASIVKNPGISAYKFVINYDSAALTPIKIIPNEDFGGTFTTNLEDGEKNNLQVLWYANEDVNLNAELFTVTFDVSNEVQIGDTFPVTAECTAKDICNINGDMFAVYIENSEIQIAEPVSGDVFEDGEVTVYDLTLLSRYVTHLEEFTMRQLMAADVNNDDVIDIKDVVRMSQYLVGWSGVELLTVTDGSSEKTSINIGNTAVDEEGIAKIPVSINNNSGIAGFVFELEYNRDEIEVLDIIPNEKFSENMKTNLGKTDDEGLFVSWYQADNMIDDEELFVIKARYLKENVSPISIKYAENNICDKNESNVETEYISGMIMSDSFVKLNEKIENNTYMAELYFDDTFKEQSAVVIVAMYDTDNALINIKSIDTTLKSGMQSISISQIADCDHYKLFIWDNMNNIRPLVSVK